MQEAKGLARDEAFDSMALMTEFFGQLRRYTPTFLELFEFRAAPVRQRLIDALKVLRDMNLAGNKIIPAGTPTDFVSARWRRFVGNLRSCFSEQF